MCTKKATVGQLNLLHGLRNRKKNKARNSNILHTHGHGLVCFHFSRVPLSLILVPMATLPYRGHWLVTTLLQLPVVVL